MSAVQRITPAYAGKRPGLLLPSSNVKDHPRVCGEKYDTYHPHMHMLGSPPRMRGKVLSAVVSPR